MNNENNAHMANGLMSKVRDWTAPQKVALVVAAASAYLGFESKMDNIFNVKYANDEITIAFLIASTAVFFLFGKKTPQE